MGGEDEDSGAIQPQNKKWYDLLTADEVDYITSSILSNPPPNEIQITIRTRNVPTVDMIDGFRTVASEPLYKLYRSILSLIIATDRLTEFHLIAEETENEGIYLLTRWLLMEGDLPPRVRKISVLIGKNTYSITEGTMVAALVLCNSITPMVAAIASNTLRDVEFARVSIYGSLDEQPEPTSLEMLLEWIRHISPPTLRMMGMGMNMRFLEALFRILPVERMTSIELDVFEYLPLYVLADRRCALKRAVIAGETPIGQVVNTFISRITIPHLILARIPLPCAEVFAGMNGVIHLTILHTKYTEDEMMKLGAGLNRMPSLEALEMRDGGDYLTLLPWMVGCRRLRYIILDSGQEGWTTPLFHSIPTLGTIRLGSVRYTRP